MKKGIISIIIVSLAGLLGYRLYQQFGRTSPSAAAPGQTPAQRVEAAQVHRGTIKEKVSLVGSLRAKERVDVTPKVSGRLVELRVDRGDHVRAGEMIARLEDGELQQQVHRAEAALEVAQAAQAQREAELENLRAELERYRGLSQSGVISPQQLDQAQTQVNVALAQLNLAKAQVAQAEAELKELRIRLSQTEIFSPLTGVVGRRYVDPGALISPNAPIVMILNIATMVSVINVPERALTKIMPGNSATVLVDAVPGARFTGRVVRISPLLDPQTRTGEVEIEIANPSQKLKAEMFARVDLNLPSRREALLIPRDALVYRGAQAGVFVLGSDVARFLTIETGLTQGDQVEVLKGLEVGQTVITRGANLLKDGDRVKVDPTPHTRAEDNL